MTFRLPPPRGDGHCRRDRHLCNKGQDHIRGRPTDCSARCASGQARILATGRASARPGACNSNNSGRTGTRCPGHRDNAWRATGQPDTRAPAGKEVWSTSLRSFRWIGLYPGKHPGLGREFPPLGLQLGEARLTDRTPRKHDNMVAGWQPGAVGEHDRTKPTPDEIAVVGFAYVPRGDESEQRYSPGIPARWLRGEQQIPSRLCLSFGPDPGKVLTGPHDAAAWQAHRPDGVGAGTGIPRTQLWVWRAKCTSTPLGMRRLRPF